jgi:purine-nucleoside phosphorylase
MNAEILNRAAAAVRRRFPDAAPRWAMVLGSGWSDVAEVFRLLDGEDYVNIPGYGGTCVRGHAGRLCLAEHDGIELLIFQGRRHWYEGVGWEPVAMPVAVSVALGVRAILLTNAAGGICPDLYPGSLMVIDDHINAMGANPLLGPHDSAWGTRFADMSETYRRDLRDRLDGAARQAGIPVSHGVYLAASGPTYETPAEIRAFRRLGADAVGMSTVPEATLANAAGLHVCGVSCITNYAAGVGDGALSHDDVIAETQRVQDRMRRLVEAFFTLSAAATAAGADATS